MLVTVVHTKGQTHELGQNGGPTGPDFDNFVATAFARRFRFLQHIAVDKRAFPNRARHLAPFLLGVTRADDQLLRRFVLVAGPGAFCGLAPRGNRVTTTRGPTFTTTVGVVDRVHDDTANTWADALVTHAAGFTVVLVRVVWVGHGTNGGHAFLTDQAQFARRQADLSVATIAAHELGIGASGTRDLTTLAGLQLDVVDDCPDGHAAEGHGVSGLDVGLLAGDDAVTDGQTLWGQDIGLLAIFVIDEGDERGPVGVIFDAFDGRRHIHFVPLEIDDPIEAFRAPACAAHRDPSGVVPSARLGQTLRKGFDRAAFPKLRTVDQYQPTLARRRRLIRLECHDCCLPFAVCGGEAAMVIGPRRCPRWCVRRAGFTPPNKRRQSPGRIRDSADGCV
mmetsp:Transcript_22421/g.36118  ORF Transcript_22421/g.36118 Transcript_22421/m.36118 type:complete len:392 (-) Transcript_22421:134-1309(-)